MINNESYVVIWGWMLNNLKLKWNELLVFATIYSFTNGTDEHCYKWSARYLSERCWLQRRQVMNVLKSLEDKGYIERKERFDNGVKFVDYYTPYANFAQGGCANFAHHNDSIDKDSIEGDWNQSPKQENNSKPAKTTALDKIKNSDDIRELFNEDEIQQYKMQLKILLKMVELWYKIKKSKSEVEKEFEWLKAKAKLYWLIQWDGNIAWNTFYQKIDKWFDWHTEKWKKVKNFKTSIIPFIEK